MKRLLLLWACLALAFTGIFAQKGMSTFGVLGSIGMFGGHDGAIYGYGIKYQYNVTDRIRIEPSCNFYGNESAYSFYGAELVGWDCSDYKYLLGLDFHYFLGAIRPLRAFAVIGCSYGKYKEGEWGENWDNTITENCFGGNFGLGVDWRFIPKVTVSFLFKQLISQYRGTHFDISIGYNF